VSFAFPRLCIRPFSRAFRDIYKAKKEHASLEDEIFKVWVDKSSVPRSIVGELRGALGSATGWRMDATGNQS
jgi:hypothetical protein